MGTLAASKKNKLFLPKTPSVQHEPLNCAVTKSNSAKNKLEKVFNQVSFSFVSIPSVVE